MSSAWFRWLVLVSLAFLLAALARGDYLAMPDIAHPAQLAASLALLVAGYTAQAAAWWAVVRRDGLPADFSSCLAGSGLAVFSKYVPGKVASILGRSLYLAERLRLPVQRLAALSLHAQLVALWTALLISVPGLAIAGKATAMSGAVRITGMAAGLLFLLLSAAIFANATHAMAGWLERRLSWRLPHIPRIAPADTLLVLPAFALQWLLWAAGFGLFSNALAPGSGGLLIGLAFPMAVVLGIVVVFAPGGLGIQEGALAAVLLLAGIAPVTATTIAVASRLWLLAGECCVFAIGAVAHSHTGSSTA